MFDEAILREYDERRGELHALAATLRSRLDAHLGPARATIHSVTHRVKDRESLRRKLLRPDKRYRALRDVTDLVGVRIVTYFDDATFEVARIVEDAFRIDLDNSLDKRRLLAPTQFGYRSLHYVGSLPDAPEEHPRFELQIRTILQHAWAEIEHDLGYKSAASVPEAIRRRFSRLAGLLELADEEFLSIRRELHAYERALREEDPAALRAVGLDRVSLDALVETAGVRRADAAVAEALDLPASDEVFYPDYLLRMLSHVGFARVDAVADALAAREAEVVAFLPHYFSFAQEAWGLSARDVGSVQRGYSLVFLAHLAALSEKDLDLDRAARVTEFFAALDYRGDRDGAARVARSLLAAYRRHLASR